MNVHPRYFIVKQAELEIEKAVYDLLDKHGLTSVERLQVMIRLPESQLKCLLRAERHPGVPNGKKADEE